MIPDPAHNVAGHLQEVARRTPDRPALIFRKTGVTTFGGLWDSVDRVSAGLAAAGLRPGDRAVLMVPMSEALYVLLLGVLKMGAAAVFVDPWVGARRIASFCAFAEPRAYCGGAKSHVLRWFHGELRRIPITVTTSARLFRFPARTRLAELRSRPGDGVIHPVRPEDPALITFTTGSSGVPKGANRNHGYLMAQHRALLAEFPYRDNDVDMPMFPIFALNNIASGLPSVVPDMDFRRVAAVDPGVILEQMKRSGVTTCTASPPFFDRLAEFQKSNPRFRPGLRRILTGGAPVGDEQLRAWRSIWPDTEIVVVYGSTEAEPVAHIRADDRLQARSAERPGSPGFCVGSPTSRLRAKVIRIDRGPVSWPEDGWTRLECARGQVGELVVCGEHVGRDYFRNPEAVKENKIVDGDGSIWHRMGDTGYFDDQGRFWLVGRVHSTIRRAGEDVHAQLVEQAAGEGDGRIVRAAAVGLPDRELGERVIVVVQTRGGADVAEDVKKRLAAAGLPVDGVEAWSRPLPVDPRHNAKVDYARLREILGGGRP